MTRLLETLMRGNADFADAKFRSELKMLPSLKTLVLGCVDPRVEPEAVLGLEPGQAAVIRNVGGRITPSTLETLAMLRKVSQAAGGDLGPGWNLVLLQHTDCGITRLDGSAGLLSSYFGVPQSELTACAAHDPNAALVRDLAVLRASELVSGELVASGLVYDVKTGRIEVVVPPTQLRG